MINRQHAQRIRQELKDVGMTPYGFMKLETDHLPEIIHNDEHIKGVVYGRLEESLDSVMLVATDKRVLFVDCKPFYKNSDEITYEVVAGVKLSTVGPFAGIVLHTRVKDYALRFVNVVCAQTFTKYIESHIEKGITHLESKDTKLPKKKTTYQPYKTPLPVVSEKVIDTILNTNTAVISTLDKAGVIHASVIHYVTDKHDSYYFLTKSDTTKAKNLSLNPTVALTIHAAGSLRSLEIQGTAELEKDPSIADIVYHQISSPKKYLEGKKLPPITKLDKGSYVVFKIAPTSVKILDFSKSSW